MVEIAQFSLYNIILLKSKFSTNTYCKYVKTCELNKSCQTLNSIEQSEMIMNWPQAFVPERRNNSEILNFPFRFEVSTLLRLYTKNTFTSNVKN